MRYQVRNEIKEKQGSGGGSGIRTPEGLAPLLVFKTSAFNRSANPPQGDAFEMASAGRTSRPRTILIV